MRTLQTELERLNLPGPTSPPQRVEEEQSQYAKRWRSDYDWSKVEAELLERQVSQTQDREIG